MALAPPTPDQNAQGTVPGPPATGLLLSLEDYSCVWPSATRCQGYRKVMRQAVLEELTAWQARPVPPELTLMWRERCSASDRKLNRPRGVARKTGRRMAMYQGGLAETATTELGLKAGTDFSR